MATERQKYNVTPVTINKSGFVDVIKNCNGFTVTNTGDDTVQVNDQIFYPGVIGTNLGDSRSYGGNENEIFVGSIKVAFAGVGANPAVEIVQKFFID